MPVLDVDLEIWSTTRHPPSGFAQYLAMQTAYIGR